MGNYLVRGVIVDDTVRLGEDEHGRPLRLRLDGPAAAAAGEELVVSDKQLRGYGLSDTDVAKHVAEGDLEPLA